MHIYIYIQIYVEPSSNVLHHPLNYIHLQSTTVPLQSPRYHQLSPDLSSEELSSEDLLSEGLFSDDLSPEDLSSEGLLSEGLFSGDLAAAFVCAAFSSSVQLVVVGPALVFAGFSGAGFATLPFSYTALVVALLLVTKVVGLAFTLISAADALAGEVSLGSLV